MWSGSLIGGYIYLRFFNPVIVTPDAMNIIATKPNRIQRRNLILVAKVLQNLSNGLLFGDKEIYMKVLNQYIQGMCSLYRCNRFDGVRVTGCVALPSASCVQIKWTRCRTTSTN